MLADKAKCTGCGACAVSCPVTCIEMREDSEGFRYPVIDHASCISCHACEATCPVVYKLPNCADGPAAYAAKHKKGDIRSASSSGGVFSALANYVLEQNGIVCGAAYSEDFAVVHQIIDTQTGVQKLRGAKYAQSKSEHLYEELKRALDSGRLVLFSGTPCQVAGLRAYLKKDYENLILVDMICHGVPSPSVWKKYLDVRRHKDADNSQITAINQRDKCSGWSRYSYSFHISYKNGNTYCVPQGTDPFMRGFVNNLFLRPSCAACSFKGLSHCADITLGDYWGIWDQYPDFDDNQGVSLVLLNSAKGQAYWQLIQQHVASLSVDAHEALTQNPSAKESSKPHPERERFFAFLDKDEVDQLIAKSLAGQAEKKPVIMRILKKLLKK